MQSVKTVDWVMRGALAVLMVAFVAVVGSAVYERPIHVVVAGEQAPPFTITADSGRRVSTPGFGGKLLVLNFWAIWCPPCIEETPSMGQFAKDYAGRGVVVVGITVDSTATSSCTFFV